MDNTFKEVSIASMKLEVKKLNKAIERKNRKISYYKDKLKKIETIMGNAMVSNRSDKTISIDGKTYLSEAERVKKHNGEKKLQSIAEWLTLFVKELNIPITNVLKEVDGWISNAYDNDNVTLSCLDYTTQISMLRNFANSNYYDELVQSQKGK